MNWGDGTTDNTQYPVQNDGTVDGTHEYAEYGNYAVRTTFFDADAQEIAVVDSTVTVADAALSASMYSGFAGNFIGSQFQGGEVATFTDSGTDMDVSDYAATINWADGTTTAGVISYNSGTGQFIVSDNTDHIYQSAATFDVTVTVYDEDGPRPPPAQARISSLGPMNSLMAVRRPQAMPTLRPRPGFRPWRTPLLRAWRWRPSPIARATTVPLPRPSRGNRPTERPMIRRAR